MPSEATLSAFREAWSDDQAREKPTARQNRPLWLPPMEGICTVENLMLNDFDRALPSVDRGVYKIQKLWCKLASAPA